MRRSRRTWMVLGGLAAAAMAVLAPTLVAAQTALEPIDPTVGEAALLEAAASVPVRDIDQALNQFPVPYVITAQSGSDPAVTVTNRAGAPTKLNVDGDKTTGRGGHDVEIMLTTQTQPPGISLTTTRLGSAPYIDDVRIVIAFPFDAFTTETLPGRPNLFLGLQTTAPGAADGGVLPATQTLQLVPSRLGGSSHTFDLDVTTDGASNPSWLFAGHFGGDHTTGTQNVAAWTTYAEPVPATLDLTLDVDNSDPLSADPLLSAAQLRWSASEVASTAVAYVEHETAPDATPDFRTHLSVPQMPQETTVAVSVDSDAGTWGLHSTSSAAYPRLVASHTRDDGLAVTADLADVPDALALTGTLAGSAVLDVSAAGVDVEASLLAPDGFAGTDGLLGRDVARLDVALADAGDLQMSHAPGDDGPAFVLEAATAVPFAQLLVGDADPPLLPDGWDALDHAYALTDLGGDATAAARVRHASAADFATDSEDVAETLTLATTQPAALHTAISADAGSAFAPAADAVDVACDVADISPDTATFATNFRTEFSYDSDPPAALDAIDCAGSIGTLAFDFALADIPGPFAFGFDPDGAVELTLSSASAADVAAAAADDPPRLGVLSMRLSDADGLPGSGDLFEEPLKDARLRLDDTPSMTASWTDDDDTAVDAATVDDEQLLGGVQVAVSTAVELAAPLDAPAADDRIDIAAESADAAATKRLAFGLFDIDELSLRHDGDTGVTDVDGLTKGGRSLAFDLATAYGPVALTATCTVDPLPAGRLDLTTDYAGTYGYTTTPAARLESVVCTGETGPVAFEAAFGDLPPALDVTLDPATGVAITPTDSTGDDNPVIGEVLLTIAHPTGFPGTGALLNGRPLHEVAFGITDVPALEGTWGRDGDGEMTAQIGTVGDAVIGSLQMSLADRVGEADVTGPVDDPRIAFDDTSVSLAQLSSPHSPAVMQALPGPARTILAALLGLRDVNIVWSQDSQTLTVFMDSLAPQLLTLNVNTAVPLFNFPFQLTCTFDELPGGQTTMTTNLAGRWTVDTQPRQPIETLGCTGKANTGNFETTFTDLPGFMDFAFFLDAVQATLRGADDDTPATLGQVRNRLFADEDTVLPASGALLGEPLAEITLQIDDTPDIVGTWAFGTDMAIDVRGTRPVLGEEPEPAPMEGFQLSAATALDSGGEALDPDTATTHSLVVQRTAPEPDEPRLAELRLFDISTATFSKEELEVPEPEEGTEPEELPEGEEPQEPGMRIDGLIAAAQSRRLEVSLLGEFPGATATEEFDIDAAMVVEKVPAAMTFSTDFTENLSYEASDAIASITLDANVRKIAPEEEAEEHPTHITAALEGLPEVLIADFDLSDRLAIVRTHSGADRLFVEATGSGGVLDTPFKWLRLEVTDVPASMTARFSDTDEKLQVDVNGWDGFIPIGFLSDRAPVGNVELSVATTSKVSALLNQLTFTNPQDSLSRTGGCFVGRTPWGEAIDGRAWAGSVGDRLDDLHCDTFRLLGGDSRVLARFDTETVDDVETEKLTWLHVDVPGIKRVDVDINKPPPPPEDPDPEDPPPGPLDFAQRVFVETEDAGGPPLFVGAHYPDSIHGDVLLTRVGSVPDSLLVHFDPTGLLEFDTSSSLGAVDVYAGPRQGATTLLRAVRLHIPSVPEEATLDLRALTEMYPLLDDPLQPALWAAPEATFEASERFEVRLLLQSLFMVQTDAGERRAGGRVRAALELEDLDLGLEVEGPGYTPCDEIAGFDTCLGLLAIREQLDLTGSDDDEGLRGFLLVEPLLGPNVPVDLDTGVEAARDEYAPLLGLMLDDFDGATFGIELQLDPKVPFNVPPFVDLETPSVDILGGSQFTFWDFGFTLQWPFPEEGEEPACSEPDDEDPVACIDKPPSYVDNTPWTWFPTFPGYVPVDPFD